VIYFFNIKPMLVKFIAGDFIAIAGEMHRLQMKKLIITSTFNPFSELLPNLYYSPIKKLLLENICIFKIVWQKRTRLQKYVKSDRIRLRRKTNISNSDY
jgi:hypothetical protein